MSLENGPFGEIEKINSYVRYLNSLEKELNVLQANKIKMELTMFENKILTDWWMTAQEALDKKVVDEYALIQCDFNNYNETIDGEIISRCPILPLNA
jgi:ATP-dependent protease ClpP protease subunit